MAIAGAAFGASKALEDIIGEQMMRARMAQQQQEQAAQLALQTRQVEGVEQDRATNRALQTRDRDLAALKYQDEQAQDATDRNIGLDAANVLSMPGMDNAAKAQELTSSVLRNPNASSASGMLKTIEGLTRKPDRDPIADHRARKMIDQEFEKPAASPKPGTHVIGGNLVDDNGKVIFTDPNKAKGDGAPSAYSQERSARTLQSVDELMGKISGKTTGWGNLAAGIPASDAMNFASELDTLKANIAFNELTAMREASKTGGALGQVSNIELRLLESALGALNPRQSPDNLKAQLSKIKESIGRWQQASGVGNMTPATSPRPNDGGKPADLIWNGKAFVKPGGE